MAAPTPPGPGWQQQLLAMLHAPVTPETMKALNAWRQAEGGTASYNPFNTTQPYAGASKYNSVGVRNYPSLQAGLQATVQTLLNGRYAPIVNDLRSGAPATKLGQDVAASPWGTGQGILRVLGAGGGTGTTSTLPGGSATQTVRPQAPAVPAANRLAPLLSSVLSSTDRELNLPSLDYSALTPAAQVSLAPTQPAAGGAPTTGGAYIPPVNGKIMRLDQGIDYQGTPGQPVRSPGPGVIDAVKDDPGGFGKAIYETLLTGPLKGQEIYVGHAQPNVHVGQRVGAGDPLATLLQHGLGNASGLSGWAEVGLGKGGVPLSNSPADLSAARRFQKFLYPNR